MRAIIDAHFLPEHHFDSLVEELRGVGCELHRNRWLKLVFIEKGEKERVQKIAKKYDQKVEFY